MGGLGMKTRFMGCIVMAAVMGVMAGCMSTPASRIKKEPGVFATFSPEIQAKVQQGQVEVGFTKDMVRLAQGLPQRVNTRITEAGQAEVWMYLGVRYVDNYVPMDSGYWYRDRSGRMVRTHDTMWMNRGYSEEYPVLRLEFSGNTVKALERLQR